MILVIIGILLAVVGVAAVAAGGFVFGVYRSCSEQDGFFVTPSQTIGSNGFALTVPDINGQLVSDWDRWGLSHARATIRVTGSSELTAPLFIGVAPTGRVSEYLSGVTRDRVTSIDLRSGTVEYDHVDGTVLPPSPQEQDFWVAQTTGTGTRTLEWTLRDGDWAVVIMNGDGSAPVVAQVSLGARFGVIYPLLIGLIAGGVLLLAGGVALTVLGARRRRTPEWPLSSPARSPGSGPRFPQ